MDFANYWFSNTGNPDMGDPFGPPGRTRSLAFELDAYFRVQGITTTQGTPYAMSFWVRVARQSKGTRQTLVSTTNFEVYLDSNGFNRLWTRVGSTEYAVPGPVYLFDHAGWYHIFFNKPSGTGNDGTMYINGHQIEGARIPYLRNSSASWIWMRRQSAETYFLRGGISQLQFVIGSNPGVEEFGNFNSKGTWVNKKYTGTYGSGVYIDFGATDPANPIADLSGNSYAADCPQLELVDTTDRYYALRYDDPAYNYATIQPNVYDVGRADGVALDETSSRYGDRGFAPTTPGYYNYSNFYPTDKGTYYWESDSWSGNNSSVYVGMIRDNYKSGFGPSLRDSSNIYNYTSGTTSFPGSNWVPTDSQRFGHLYNLDTGDWTYRRIFGGTIEDIGTNNIYSTIQVPRDEVHNRKMALGGAHTVGSLAMVFNWGQKPFINPPAGVTEETHGCHSFNMEDPPILDPQTEFKILRGPGATILDEAKALFPKGLWWIKDRENSQNWQFVDSIAPTSAKTSPTLGFSAYSPPAGESYAFCWNVGTDPVPMNGGTINANVAANKKAGFSMGTFVGNGLASQTFEHGLDEAPEFVIIHNETTGTIMVYHVSAGANYYYRLNQYNQKTQSGQSFTGNTATTIGIGTNVHLNGSGNTHHFYAWHSVPMFSYFERTYVGGAYYSDCQFDPALVMVKSLTSNAHWSMSNKISGPLNPVRQTLATSLANGERAVTATEEHMHFSTGFSFWGTDARVSNPGCVMAWASVPSRGKNIATPTAR